MVEHNPVIENVLGTISLILQTVQLVPQIVHTHLKFRLKQKQQQNSENSINDANIKIQDPLEGLSLMMPLIWYVGVIFQCAYFVYLKVNAGLLIQPHGFAFFSSIIILQYGYVNGGYYWRDFKLGIFDILKKKATSNQDLIQVDELEMKERDSEDDFKACQDQLNSPQISPDLRKKRNIHVLIAFIILVTYWIVIEVTMYYALVGEGTNESSTPSALVWFITLFPAVLTVLGYVPQVSEIIVTKSVHGLSPVFLTMDCVGSIFGVISLVFTDYSQSGVGSYLTQFFLASMVYIVVAVGSILLIALSFVYRPKKSSNN